MHHGVGFKSDGNTEFELSPETEIEILSSASAQCLIIPRKLIPQPALASERGTDNCWDSEEFNRPRSLDVDSVTILYPRI
jgi:hypothetical protein